MDYRKCIVFIAFLLIEAIDGEITDDCIDCIGKVEKGPRDCNKDGRTLSCGLYQIEELYWIECGRLGTSWKECALNDHCSRQCIKAYMAKHKSRCQNFLKKEDLTCMDYGRMHNRGLNGCSGQQALQYVNNMKRNCPASVLYRTNAFTPRSTKADSVHSVPKRQPSTPQAPARMPSLPNQQSHKNLKKAFKN